MAAAVSDYRPKSVPSEKLSRHDMLVLEFVPTEDVAAAASQVKRLDQRIIGFSLEQEGNIERARAKLLRKELDLMVYNPTRTMNASDVEATLLWSDGRSETLPSRSKADFADILLQRARELFQ
jgi:phosphopantothenoylcysteine decarboxylase / phosphopantothenate---cysteine ligase